MKTFFPHSAAQISSAVTVPPSFCFNTALAGVGRRGNDEHGSRTHPAGLRSGPGRRILDNDPENRGGSTG
jgi:hypothetical protein